MSTATRKSSQNRRIITSSLRPSVSGSGRGYNSKLRRPTCSEPRITRMTRIWIQNLALARAAPQRFPRGRCDGQRGFRVQEDDAAACSYSHVLLCRQPCRLQENHANKDARDTRATTVSVFQFFSSSAFLSRLPAGLEHFDSVAQFRSLFVQLLRNGTFHLALH
jgi:hypothetical protein